MPGEAPLARAASIVLCCWAIWGCPPRSAADPPRVLWFGAFSGLPPAPVTPSFAARLPAPTQQEWGKAVWKSRVICKVFRSRCGTTGLGACSLL